MAIVATDWEISGTGNLDIRYTGNAHTGAAPSYATVLEFHRFLQDLADDAVAVQASSDFLDITDETPSDRATDNIITLLNGYNIDDTAAEHLFDGSITQGTGATETIYSGLVVLGSAPDASTIQVIQDGAVLTNYWGAVGDAAFPGRATGVSLNGNKTANVLLRIMIKTRVFGTDIDDKKVRVHTRDFGQLFSEFSTTLAAGNAVAAISTATDLNNSADPIGDIADGTFSNTEGYQLLDVGTQTVGSEPYYSQWDWVSAPTDTTNKANDLYEYAKYIQRSGTAETIHGLNGELFRGITHEVPYTSLSGTLTTNDDLVWGTEVAWDTPLTAAGTVGAYYTFSLSGAKGKLLALDDNTTVGFAVFQLEAGSAAPVNNDIVTRADGTAADGFTVNVTVLNGTDSGGYGRILADNGVDTVWIQLVSGAFPASSLPLWEATAAGVYDNATGAKAVAGTVVPRTVSPVFIGTSTGSAIIGAFGIAFAINDVTQNDQFFDLTNTLQSPPNIVSFSVNGPVAAEDRILVGPEAAGALDISQLTVDTALTTDLSAGGDWSLIVDEAEPGNTPSPSGTIRVIDNNGVHRGLVYNAISGTGPTTFTIDVADTTTQFGSGSQDFSGVGVAVANKAYVTYVDKVAASDPEIVSFIFDGVDTFFVRVRDGGTAGDAVGIKTFETTAGVGTSGGSATVIRTADA